MGALIGKFRKVVWAQLAKRSPGENKYLALIPAVGVLTGLSAVGIAHIIAFFQKVFWGSGQNLLDAAEQMPWHYRIMVLAVGGLLVGLLGWWCKMETRGSGTSTMVHALAMKGGRISLNQTIPKVIAGVLTVSTGGSLGREGPMTQFGGALGSHLGRRFKLTTQQVRILLCAAAAAAIAAVYNCPIGGSLFAMEILIGSFALEILGPVVIASVISTLIFRSAMGELPRFVIPQYRLVTAWELPAYLALGILAGIAAVLFVKSLFWAENLFKKSRLPRPVQPLVGFALVGLIGCVYPHVLGNGYEPVNMALHEGLPLKLLLILPLAKLVATALTLGSGGAGGLFLPSLMVGALLGGAFGQGLNQWFPGGTGGPGAYALVGMGGVLAGTTHAPITAIMMIFEQTNSYTIILPLMFVCIISNATVRLFRISSYNEEVLRRRGVVLPRGPEGSVMQNLRVSDLMHPEVVAVEEDAPFGTVVERFLHAPYNHQYVIDRAGRFKGAIPLHAIKGMLHQREGLEVVVAHDLVDETFEFLTPTMPLAETMEVFWRRHCERLPVVDGPDTRQLIGWISKRDLIGVYSQEILQKRPLLSRFTVANGDDKKQVMVELPEGFQLQALTVPAGYAGRTLAELGLRSTYRVHVLQVKHLDPVTGTIGIEVPGPDSRLAPEDQLIVIGTVMDIARLMGDMALAQTSDQS